MFVILTLTISACWVSGCTIFLDATAQELDGDGGQQISDVDASSGSDTGLDGSSSSDAGLSDSGSSSCESACDPIDIGASGGQVVSEMVDGATVLVANCPAVVGGNYQGDPCGDNSDCWVGYFCTENSTCARICTLTSECPEGTACVLPANHSWGACGYGVCQ